jgi:hypothetical protein
VFHNLIGPAKVEAIAPPDQLNHSAAVLSEASMFKRFLLLTFLVFQGIDRHLPPAVEAKLCTPRPENERPNDRFARKGGRETKASVRLHKGLLTVNGVEQGRDLSLYERVDLGSVRNESASALADARMFLWEHWSKQTLGYLTLTGSSEDATSTSHIFIERDEAGRWRVAWRIVRHNGLIHDLPTYYAVGWVRPGGWGQPGLPLGVGEQPDSKEHELEFRDKCGDIEQSL